MIKQQELEDYILSMADATVEHPYEDNIAVYKVGGKMFALIPESRSPLSVSLKCDPQLAKLLREKYETVMPGHHLNNKHWNTIVLTGQLPWDEVKALILHSYNLTIEA